MENLQEKLQPSKQHQENEKLRRNCAKNTCTKNCAPLNLEFPSHKRKTGKTSEKLQKPAGNFLRVPLSSLCKKEDRGRLAHPTPTDPSPKFLQVIENTNFDFLARTLWISGRYGHLQAKSGIFRRTDWGFAGTRKSLAISGVHDGDHNRKLLNRCDLLSKLALSKSTTSFCAFLH